MKIKSLATGLVLSSSLALSACGTVPQNPDEFVSQLSKAMIGATNEKETIRVKYSSARNILRKKVMPCLSGTVRTTFSYSDGRRSSIDKGWNVKFLDLSKNKSRMTLQIDSNKALVLGGGKLPEGGGYVAVIDLTRKSSTTTQVSYHMVNTYGVKDDVYQPTRDFLAGKNGMCKFS